jgi:hypothetical protein
MPHINQAGGFHLALKLHLTDQASLHWYLIIQWLYLSRAINHSLLLSFQHMECLREWMAVDWHQQAPAKLFSCHQRTAKDTMVKQLKALSTYDSAHLVPSPAK